MSLGKIANSRWMIFGFVLAMLAADLWTKQWAARQLASPAHPMLAWRAQSATPAAALAALGVDQSALSQAVDHGALARLRKSQLRGDQVVSAEMVGVDLVVDDGIGMPAPRRLRLGRPHVGERLHQVLADAWRVDSATADTLLQDHVWQANFRPFDATQPWQAEDAGVALLDRDIPLVDGYLRLVYAENKGAAWSFLESMPTAFRVGLFATISSVASLAMAFWLWRRMSTSALMAWSVAAILAGALGNLANRVSYTVVIDFIYMYVIVGGKTHGWPVYNVADIGITVGVVLIGLESLFAKPAQPPVLSPPPSTPTDPSPSATA